MQHCVEKDLGWGLKVKALPRRCIVCGDDAVEMCGLDRVEVCFSREKSSQSAVSVFDPAFLPGCVRIAEVGLQTEWMQQEVSSELGSIVEGERFAEVFGDHLQQP